MHFLFRTPAQVLARRIVFLCAIFFCISTDVAHAGFGITPPYVRNDRLTRGTTYEQVITLVRSDPTDDLQADITMNIPGIEDWISVDKGTSFLLPKGALQVPITIRVTVPEDAAYTTYRGAIRIRTSSPATQSSQSTGVSIALGAQVDVALEVVDKIYDFYVRKIRLLDLEEGRRKWGLFFPAKMSFFMTVENTGNTPFGPTKVQFDIYDSEMEQLLETSVNTNNIEKVEPFATKEVVAELPTRLPPGRYIAKYTIYKNEAVAQQNEITLSISSIGSVPGYEGYGFVGLSTADKLKVAAAFGIIFMLLLVLVFVLTRRRRTRVRPPEPFRVQ